MESDGENTLVINDLLSFMSCKISNIPRKKLLSITKEFYPKEEISQAYSTLLECIPKSYSSTNPKKELLEEISELILKLPEEISPIFVCQNINNVPQIKNKKSTSALTFVGLNLTSQQQQELSQEHASLQSQISDVSRVVRQLKDQIEILANKCETYDKQANLKKTLASGKSVKPSKKSLSTEKMQDLMEEITGALIDTTRIRALRGKTDEDSSHETDSSPKKGKRNKASKRKADDEFTRVSSSSDLQSSMSEVEEPESRMTVVKDCSIPLGRFDESTVIIKKEIVDIEENCEDLVKSGRRPHRQKFSKFSEDFVVDFGSRSTKKSKK